MIRMFLSKSRPSFERARRHRELAPPYRFLDRLARHDLVHVVEQEFDDVELTRGQADRVAVDLDDALDEVDLDVVDVQILAIHDDPRDSQVNGRTVRGALLQVSGQVGATQRRTAR
ncbi:hypothetical protein BMAPRL20_0861 [Burkholderia mallei PRL-20]|nr:hypothetical protein BMA10399_L0035 [Burkholderia mallei ATCC 10399]EES46800.1 hypothetical protein BMAPRL20_0861 [Burkholderia mallei PRL-20]